MSPSIGSSLVCQFSPTSLLSVGANITPLLDADGIDFANNPMLLTRLSSASMSMAARQMDHSLSLPPRCGSKDVAVVRKAMPPSVRLKAKDSSDSSETVVAKAAVSGAVKEEIAAVVSLEEKEAGDDWSFELEWEEVIVEWNPFLMVSRLNAFVISVEDMLQLYPDEISTKKFRRQTDKMAQFRAKSFVWFFDKKAKAVERDTDGDCGGGELDEELLSADPWTEASTWLSDEKKAAGARSRDRSGLQFYELSTYLAEWCHGVILEINGEPVTGEIPSEFVMEQLANDLSFGARVKVGLLRGRRSYCQSAHEWCLDWRSLVCERLPHAADVCLSCRSRYDGDAYAKDSELPWLLAASKWHRTQHTRLCGVCMLHVLQEATDPVKLSVQQYLDRNLTRPEKVKELCLIHRLFSSSERLMRSLLGELKLALASGTGAHHVDDGRSLTRVVHVINFVSHWIDLLWDEDFALGRESRTLLNDFISVLHRLSFCEPQLDDDPSVSSEDASDEEEEEEDSSSLPMDSRVLDALAFSKDEISIVFEGVGSDGSSLKSSSTRVSSKFPLLESSTLLQEKQRQVIRQSTQRLLASYQTKWLADKQQIFKDEVELWGDYLLTMSPSVGPLLDGGVMQMQSPAPLPGGVLSPKMSVTELVHSKVVDDRSRAELQSVYERREFDRLLREKRKMLDLQHEYNAEYLKLALKRKRMKVKADDSSLKRYTDAEVLVEMEEGKLVKEEKDVGLDEVTRHFRFILRHSVRTAIAEMQAHESLLLLEEDSASLRSPTGSMASSFASTPPGSPVPLSTAMAMAGPGTDDRLITTTMSPTSAASSRQRGESGMSVMSVGSGSRKSMLSETCTTSTARTRAQATAGTSMFSKVFGGSEQPSEMALLRELCIERRCELLASQLTLLMYDKFRAIRPTELLSKGWTQKDKEKQSPHVVDFIFFCESISVWTQMEVIVERAPARVQAIERMIRIGIALEKMHNQYAQLQLYAGLDSPKCQRFKRSWKMIKEDKSKPELKRFMEDCAGIMSSSRNFRNIRDMLWSLETPAIPFLGIFLKDFFMIDELLKKSIIGRASPDQTEKLWSLYKRLDAFRQAPYTFEEVAQVQKYWERELESAQLVDVSLLSKLVTRLAQEEREQIGKSSTSWFSR